ncbi:hypothetical protein TEA_005348 [Camellia sinensis var. sinensis]|uniref:Phospholipase n=1 Tax=Camellia sinensis var. sinensis TaxID=542762 RepID=A0A4S4EPL4_CAMSN|nr:hypothetical protein TEA_005348 [Camellia sinensis var. sinensis]
MHFLGSSCYHGAWFYILRIDGKFFKVREWLQNLGIGDHTTVVQDDDEHDDETVPSNHDESTRGRDVPSSAALPIIRPALGRQHSISDRAKVAMQGYLNHFLSKIDIVNSRKSRDDCDVAVDVELMRKTMKYLERCLVGRVGSWLRKLASVTEIQIWVCKFLEVSKLSFSPECGPKLKEDYVMVKHLPKIPNNDDYRRCCACPWFSCCNDNWQKIADNSGSFKIHIIHSYIPRDVTRGLRINLLGWASQGPYVWAVLKPGFFSLLKDPFDTKPLDVIVFDVLPASDGNGEGRVSLAKEIKEPNPLRHSFKVSCGNWNIQLRTKSNAKVNDWVAAINDAGIRPPEGWCHPHHFGSFAPPRGLTEDGSQAQWFVDGLAAFGAIALAIEEAKSELNARYLSVAGGCAQNCTSDVLFRLMHPLGLMPYWKKKPRKVFRFMYFYTKRLLLLENQPVSISKKALGFMRISESHHEKRVIVDYQICFIGGLDLCFGRYDSFEHQVGDYPPTVWPGKDYYNPSESEPNSWEDTMKDELDRQKYPRMPWHDVHCALWGPPCRDVARHFVQRWNYAKRNRAPNEQAIPLLMPQHHMVIPHYMGGSEEMEVQTHVGNDHKDIRMQDSFSSRSSFQDVPLLLPQEADGLDTLTGDPKLNGLARTWDFRDQPSRGNRSPFSFRKPQIDPSTSNLPMKGFVDDLGTSDYQHELPSDAMMLPGIRSSDKEWWETQERSDQVVSADETGQVGPRISCHCQVGLAKAPETTWKAIQVDTDGLRLKIIRSVSQWTAGTNQIEESIHNAYCSLIEKAEHFIYIEETSRSFNSLFLFLTISFYARATYLQNQFFISGLLGDEVIRNGILESLYRRIMRAYNEKKCFRAFIIIPLLPGFQGGVDDGGAAAVRTIMHWQYRTICRGHNSILHNLYDLLGSRMHDYISFYGLRAYGRLFDGSANINDRSLLGSRDSEIGVLVEDKEFVDSCMGGKPWKAGKFSSSLRLTLWSEHLGLPAGEISQINDPVVDSTYKDIWMATAKTNTMIYQDVFSCIPNDLIHSRVALKQCTTCWKEKLGHTTIDLGIAPEKLESYQDGNIKGTDPLERLESVKGHLVSFPLDFMSREDLRPGFSESEYYASQVFH